MKSRLPKTKTADAANVAVKIPRKRISVPLIKTITSRVKTIEPVSAIAALFSPEEIHQLIQKKAYEIFEYRSYQHGHDVDDWLEAERIISAELDLV